MFFRSYKKRCIEEMQSIDCDMDGATAKCFYETSSLSFEVARQIGLKGRPAIIFACKYIMDAFLVINTYSKKGDSFKFFEKMDANFSPSSEMNFYKIRNVNLQLAKKIKSSTQVDGLPEKFELSLERFEKMMADSKCEMSGLEKTFNLSPGSVSSKL